MCIKSFIHCYPDLVRTPHAHNPYLLSVIKASFVVIVLYVLFIQAVLMNILTGDGLRCDFHKIRNRFATLYFIIVMEVCPIIFYFLILSNYAQQQLELSGWCRVTKISLWQSYGLAGRPPKIRALENMVWEERLGNWVIKPRDKRMERTWQWLSNMQNSVASRKVITYGWKVILMFNLNFPSAFKESIMT